MGDDNLPARCVLTAFCFAAKLNPNDEVGKGTTYGK